MDEIIQLWMLKSFQNGCLMDVILFSYYFPSFPQAHLALQLPQMQRHVSLHVSDQGRAKNGPLLVWAALGILELKERLQSQTKSFENTWHTWKVERYILLGIAPKQSRDAMLWLSIVMDFPAEIKITSARNCLVKA